jgi:hypothetical protein
MTKDHSIFEKVGYTVIENHRKNCLEPGYDGSKFEQFSNILLSRQTWSEDFVKEILNIAANVLQESN